MPFGGFIQKIPNFSNERSNSMIRVLSLRHRRHPLTSTVSREYTYIVYIKCVFFFKHCHVIQSQMEFICVFISLQNCNNLTIFNGATVHCTKAIAHYCTCAGSLQFLIKTKHLPSILLQNCHVQKCNCTK